MKIKHHFNTIFLCITFLIMFGCNPVKTRINTLRGINDIPQKIAKEDSHKRLWVDLYLEDSTIVFVHKEDSDRYVNGIWGDDYKELFRIVDSENFLSYGSEELKSLFLDVYISNYGIRHILLDFYGDTIYSFEYNVSELKKSQAHRIDIETLKRLLELSTMLLPIHTIEGVTIEDATWNDAENRIDFRVFVNRRPVSSKTNPEHKAGTYYEYDETLFRSYIEGNWYDMFWGLSHIIEYNKIQISFNIDNQGVITSLPYYFK